MRFRTGLIIGGAVGYVLGAKAGTERYEQIRDAYQSFVGTGPVQKVIGETRNAAGQSTARARSMVSDQLQSISEHVRDIAEDKLGK